MPRESAQDHVLRAVQACSPRATVLGSWTLVAECLESDGKLVTHGLNVEGLPQLLAELSDSD